MRRELQGMLSNKSARYSLRQLARHFNCAPNTIRNELKCGAHHNTGRYGARRAQNAYDKSHANSIKKSRRFLSSKFVSWMVETVIEKGWSLDACYGYAKTNKLFSNSEMICVKTLCNYVESIIFAMRNIDLLFLQSLKITQLQKYTLLISKVSGKEAQTSVIMVF